MKTIILTCLLSSLASTTAFAATQVEFFGDDGYPPYSFAEKGEVVGIYPDILKQVSAKLAPDYEIVLKPVPWKRGLEEIKSGTSLALFPPYYSKDREAWMKFSSPIYTEEVVVFCSEKAMAKPRKNFPADFTGLSVGVNAGFALGETFLKAGKDKKITVVEAPNNDLNIRKLATGRIDCYANDRISVQYALKKMLEKNPDDKDLKDFKLREAAVSSQEKAFVGISRGYKNLKTKDDFEAKLNKAIEATVKEGKVKEVISNWSK